jgi:trk system potassium uptake protein TrkA
MSVIILGAGYTGYEIAKQLSLKGRDVSVIDADKFALKKIEDKLDVRSVLGNAIDPDVLSSAGSTNVSAIIALTSSDETNILACQIASFVFGSITKIAQINNRAYYENDFIFGKDKILMDMMISPEAEIVFLIKKSILSYGALDIIPCFEDKIRIVGVVCSKHSVFISTQIRFVNNIANKTPITILFIKRGERLFIPSKTDSILAEDNVYFLAKQEDMLSILELWAANKEQDSGKLILVGNSTVCAEIIRSIRQEDMLTTIKIIDNSHTNQVETLLENFDDVDVIRGNPLNPDVFSDLLEENSRVISLTDDDQTNILVCLLAQKHGIKKAIAIVNDTSNMLLATNLGVNTILSSKKIVISKILDYIEKKDDNFIVLTNDQMNIIAIEVREESSAVGILIDDLKQNEKVVVATLIRNDEIYMMPKRMAINVKDKILLVVEKKLTEKITSLFKKKPKYLI